MHTFDEGQAVGQRAKLEWERMHCIHWHFNDISKPHFNNQPTKQPTNQPANQPTKQKEVGESAAGREGTRKEISSLFTEPTPKPERQHLCIAYLFCRPRLNFQSTANFSSSGSATQKNFSFACLFWPNQKPLFWYRAVMVLRLSQNKLWGFPFPPASLASLLVSI